MGEPWDAAGHNAIQANVDPRSYRFPLSSCAHLSPVLKSNKSTVQHLNTNGRGGRRQRSGELHMAEGHLMYIAGEQVSAASGATEAVVNPATNERIATVPMGDATDVDRAVAAADEAFDDWAATTPGKRAELLLKLADRLETHAEEFAQLESLDVGKPISVARGEVPFGV